MRGFTLLELLVVLVIIGIVASVAVPALRPSSHQDVRAAAGALASTYAGARRAATARAAPVTVSLELRTGWYAAVAQAGSEAAPDTVAAGRLALPAGVTLEGGRDGWAVAVFDALGRMRGDVVALVDGERRYEIATDVWTGASDVHRR